MGQAGEDIILSPAARKVFNLDIECKNCEVLSVVKVFQEHYNKYSSKNSLKLLTHTKNRSTPLVTLRWEDFVKILNENIHMKKMSSV